MDLQRQQPGGGQGGQILGPAPLATQPPAFQAFEHGVSGGGQHERPHGVAVNMQQTAQMVSKEVTPGRVGILGALQDIQQPLRLMLQGGGTSRARSVG